MNSLMLGCHGGLSYLVAGKYGEDFGLVTENCNPHKELQPSPGVTCSTRKTCRRYYTTNYEYIGGYYGAYVSHYIF